MFIRFILSKDGFIKSSVSNVVVLFNEPTNELKIAPKITAPNKPKAQSGSTELTSAGYALSGVLILPLK